MKKKVIFRADGNSSTGLGHMYRLFSLVEIVKDTFDFVFLTHETSADTIIPISYTKEIIPASVSIENEPLWLASNFSVKEYIIIADGYQFIEPYQLKIKGLGYKLMYVDDLAKEHMYADIVINHSPYIMENHYSKEVYTKLALGTQYALLRPLFLNQAKQNKSIKEIDCAFVCFGGADPFNLTIKAVKALLKIPIIKKINVVLGGAFKHKEIFDLQVKNVNRIKIFKNLSEEKLIMVMQESNFAIAPASTILYELCCVKMPVLSGFYVDNQELIYKGFLNSNAVYNGENIKNYTVLDFKMKIESILKRNNFDNQIKAQRTLFDEEIGRRHLNLIKTLC